MTLNHLLQTIQPGLLDSALAPIRARLESLLKTEHLGSGEAQKRIRILSMAARSRRVHHFQTVAAAVLRRKRLVIDYYNRDRDETSTREISPQRLVHYRDNWYLDAGATAGRACASSPSNASASADASEQAAKAVPEATLNKELASAYGIFAGKPPPPPCCASPPSAPAGSPMKPGTPSSRAAGCRRPLRASIPYGDRQGAHHGHPQIRAGCGSRSHRKSCEPPSRSSLKRLRANTEAGKRRAQV